MRLYLQVPICISSGAGNCTGGPLWDFDYVAWGDTDYSEELDVYGFVQSEQTWFARLLEDRAFAEKLAARWPAIKAKLLELSHGWRAVGQVL